MTNKLVYVSIYSSINNSTCLKSWEAARAVPPAKGSCYHGNNNKREEVTWFIVHISIITVTSAETLKYRK